MPWTAEAIPGATPGDVPNGAALDGAGETLVLWDGPMRGMQVHPVSPTAQPGPAEPVLADACAGGGGRLAADPSSTVAAIAYQGRPHGLWITYRDAAAPALEATPRICDLRWSPQLPGAHRARAGRIKLYLRLSKPVARIVVTVRGRHRRVLSNTRLGPRPVGYTSVTLRGPHSALPCPWPLQHHGPSRRHRWSALTPDQHQPPRCAAEPAHDVTAGAAAPAAARPRARVSDRAGKRSRSLTNHDGGRTPGDATHGEEQRQAPRADRGRA